MTKDKATASPKDAALKLALDLAIMHHSDDGYAELRLKVRQLAKEALAPTSTQCEVQPKPQPLTLNEMSAIEEKVYMQTTHKGKPLFEYAQALIRATEAAHNIGAKP